MRRGRSKARDVWAMIEDTGERTRTQKDAPVSGSKSGRAEVRKEH